MFNVDNVMTEDARRSLKHRGPSSELIVAKRNGLISMVGAFSLVNIRQSLSFCQLQNISDQGIIRPWLE